MKEEAVEAEGRAINSQNDEGYSRGWPHISPPPFPNPPRHPTGCLFLSHPSTLFPQPYAVSAALGVDLPRYGDRGSGGAPLASSMPGTSAFWGASSASFVSPFPSFLILYVRAHSGPTFIHMYTSIYMHIDPPRTVYYTLLSPSRTPLDSFAFNLVGVRAFLDAFPPWRATYIFVFVCPTPTHRTSVCRVHL